MKFSNLGILVANVSLVFTPALSNLGSSVIIVPGLI